MSNHRLRGSIKARGYCCIYAGIRSNRQLNTSKLAAFFMVSRDTIQYWKAKMRLKECHCEHKANCMKRLRGGLG